MLFERAKALITEPFFVFHSITLRFILFKPNGSLVWLACFIAKGFSLVTAFDSPTISLHVKRQRQDLVKHSS
jgi:hypothetical protein